MTPPESQPGALPKIMPTTLTHQSSALGTLWVRGLNAGDMFRVAERFPELVSTDDSVVMRTVAEESVARDPAGDQLLSESELALLGTPDLAAIASLMCQIDEVALPDGSDPVGIYASFAKHEVLKLSELGDRLRNSLGSSILSPGTIDRITQSYAGGILSDRFIDKASARASQLSAPPLPSFQFPVDTRPQRMEGIAQDTLEAHLQILRRLNEIAQVAEGVQLDRATQQQKDSRNLKIAMASLIASVVLSLASIWITYDGVRKADAANTESGVQYQQMIDLQRRQLDEAKSLSAELQQQPAALQTEIQSTQPGAGTQRPSPSSQSGTNTRKPRSTR